MKKAFFILLAIVYLVSSAGATVQLHYCMDKLVGIDMHESQNEICVKCGMKKKEGCCKDESKQIKVADDQKPASKFVFNVLTGGHSEGIYLTQYSIFFILTDLYVEPLTSGPPNSGIGRYIYLRVFRI